MIFSLKKRQKAFFKENGYLVIENCIDKKKINKLKKNSYDLFNGKYQTKIAPDKVKWSIKTKKNQIKEPRQLCNVWKSNNILASVILSKKIGKFSSELMNWSGVRLSQDSLFWVPPKTGGVTMHQDNVYQDWHLPGKLITVWIALTNTGEKNGGIEFISGSHKWKRLSKPVKNFFGGKNYKYSLKKFKKNISTKSVVPKLKAGSISFHHGNLWHGSNMNKSNKDRISISCHFMPINSRFHPKNNNPTLSHYKKFTTSEMDDNFFPILWGKGNVRSKFLSKLK